MGPRVRHRGPDPPGWGHQSASPARVSLPWRRHVLQAARLRRIPGPPVPSGVKPAVAARAAALGDASSLDAQWSAVAALPARARHRRDAASISRLLGDAQLAHPYGRRPIYISAHCLRSAYPTVVDVFNLKAI